MPTKGSISDAVAKRLKPPAKGQVDYFDKQYPGLALRASCGGRKAWYYVYRVNGKQRLDICPAMSVAEVRVLGARRATPCELGAIQSLRCLRAEPTLGEFLKNGCSAIKPRTEAMLW